MYKINPAKYSGVTVIPSEIIEDHLILCSASQLKVILCAYSLAGGLFDEKALSDSTGVSVNEVRDALSYWSDRGFVLRSEEEAVFFKSAETREIKKAAASEVKTEEASESISEISKKSKVSPNNPPRLKYDEICKRIGESEDIRILLNEAQLKLGRTIGTGDQSSLILLHDYYGLPIEVILSICEYAGSKGKSANMNYIYKVGTDWSQREIDTIEAADRELKKLESISSVWGSFAAEIRLTGVHPTSSQEKYIRQWSDEWHFPLNMLVLAYDEMMLYKDKFSFSYIHKILSDWHKKGIDTPEKAAAQKEKFRKEQDEKALKKSGIIRSTPEKLTPDPTASYDIKLAEEMAKNTVPKVKKREKR